MIAIKNILVATDFGPASRSALAYGRELARTFGATLHVLHVVEDVRQYMLGGEGGGLTGALPQQLQAEREAAARVEMNKLIAEVARAEPEMTAVVESSVSVGGRIVEYAAEQAIDVIVIGTHGRGAFSRMMMGSVAERVVRAAPCPVLTVKHPEHEFISPGAIVETAHA
jgi:nucleotide-binding universal stress UspA family protein